MMTDLSAMAGRAAKGDGEMAMDDAALVQRSGPATKRRAC